VIEGDVRPARRRFDRQHGVGIVSDERRGDVERDRGVLVAAGGAGGERRVSADRVLDPELCEAGASVCGSWGVCVWVGVGTAVDDTIVSTARVSVVALDVSQMLGLPPSLVR